MTNTIRYLPGASAERTTDEMPPLVVNFPDPTLPAPVPESAPICPRCKGLGWLRNDVPYNHPKFGSSKFLVRCDCTATAQIIANAQRVYTWLGVNEDLSGHTFEAFYPERQPDTTRFLTAKRYLQGYAEYAIADAAPGNILICGSYGTGKTHLVAATLNKLRTAGKPCLFCTAPALFDALYAADFDGKEAILRQACETPLLAIDDLDKLHIGHRANKEDEGRYQKSVFFRILNARYQAHLATILTTNEQRDLSPWLDGAAMSRLQERLQGLDMNGVDYRLRQRR